MLENYTRKTLLILHIYLAISLVVITNFLVFKFYNPQINIDISQIRQHVLQSAFSSSVEELRIEAKERLSYFLNIILTPLLVFLAFLFSRNLSIKNAQNLYKNLTVFSLFLSLIFLVFIIIKKIKNFIIYLPDYTLSQKIELYSSPYLLVFALLLVIFFCMNAKTAPQRATWFKPRCNLRVLLIISFLLSLFITSYSLFDQNNFEYFSLNFSAVFNPAIQTFLGKAPLINQKTLYGLNAYFFAFLLKIFGGNIKVIIYANALLLLVSLLAVAFAFFKVIQNKFLAFLGFCTLIFTQFFAEDYWPSKEAISFQYEPIRLIFPSLLLAFFASYFSCKTQLKYYFAIAFFTLGVWWNIDVGVPTFLVLAMFIIYDKKQNIVKCFLEIVAIFILISAIFILFLRLKYEFWPDFSQIFYGQNAALNFGYAMLNSQKFGLWCLPIFIYIIGLVFFVENFLAKKHDLQNIFIAILTILGLGLFSYYVGRSHDNNILHCFYPAVFILTIFADKFLTDLRIKLSAEFFLKSLPLIAICYFASALLFSLVSLNSLRINFFTNNFTKNSSEIIEFIAKGNDVLIVSENDCDYLLSLNLLAPSPFNFVNYRHAFYKKEIVEINNFIKSKQKKYVILIHNKSPFLMSVFSKEEMKEIVRIVHKNYDFYAKKIMPKSEIEVFVLK